MDEKRLSEIEKELKGRTVRSLIAEIRRLREALAFYGDDKMYDWHDKEMGVSYTELDRGKRARVALGLEPAPETPPG